MCLATYAAIQQSTQQCICDHDKKLHTVMHALSMVGDHTLLAQPCDEQAKQPYLTGCEMGPPGWGLLTGARSALILLREGGPLAGGEPLLMAAGVYWP